MARRKVSERAGWLRDLADAVAGELRVICDHQLAWDEVRDTCDQRTGGELHTVPLDILTDMVASRLAKMGCPLEART